MVLMETQVLKISNIIIIVIILLKRALSSLDIQLLFIQVNNLFEIVDLIL